MKRGLAVLAVLLMLSLAPVPALGVLAAPQDIPADSEQAQVVSAVSDAGIMRGYGGLFRPDDPATRAHMAAVLGRTDRFIHVDELYAATTNEDGVMYRDSTNQLVIQAPTLESELAFSDVAASAYYAYDLNWAIENNVLVFAGPLYDPKKPVTYNELLLAFGTLVSLEGGTDSLSVFQQALDESSWLPEESARGTQAARIDLARFTNTAVGACGL